MILLKKVKCIIFKQKLINHKGHHTDFRILINNRNLATKFCHCEINNFNINFEFPEDSSFLTDDSNYNRTNTSFDLHMYY